MARVALATFGSGGDLFPFIPIANRLREDGHEPVFVVPRSLGLYVRRLGLRSFPIGDGREMRVYDDDVIYTNRFHGWASWRTVYNDYIAPSLDADIRRIREFFAEWRPDVVATSNFAVAARVAALTDHHPHRVCSIYPQMLGLRAHRRSNFPRRFMSQLAEVTSRDVLRDHRSSDLAWGCDGPVTLLHDAALLGDVGACGEAAVVGFPYWDDVPVSREELDSTIDWIRDSADPTVAVTMGSFVGQRPIAAWNQLRSAATELGARAVLVGATNARVELANTDDERVLRTGFLPLSKLLPHTAAVAHHGGIGTMFAAARAGVPAVVVPQAFDQSFAAGLVERSGIGVDGARTDVREAIRSVLSCDSIREKARQMPGRMIDSRAATCAAVTSILDASDGGST